MLIDINCENGGCFDLKNKAKKKNGFIDNIKEVIFNDNFDYNDGITRRLLNVLLAVTFVAGTISVVKSFLDNPGFMGNYSSMLLVVFVGIVFWLSVRGNFKIAVGLFVSLAVVLFLPMMYLTNGGSHSGMQLWYILGILLPLLALRGKMSIIVFLLSLASAKFVMLLEQDYPDWVVHNDDPQAAANDVMVSFEFFAIIIGLLFKYQTMLFERQRKKMLDKDKALQKAMEQAQSANVAKSSFLAHMSHEIRTPINAVLGMDEMIIRESTDKDITAYALNIRSAGNSLLTIINDILDFSKIESDKMDIIPAVYDLPTMLKDCYNLVFMRAINKELRFTFEVDPRIPKNLIGDEFRIRQIITNLLTNAVKYTPEGSVTLSATFDRIDKEHIMLVVAVEDTGMGISDDDKGKLFDSFKRINTSQTKSIEGTGLGLAITKRLVDLMEGNILVESEYGKGTIFTVKLPQGFEGRAITGNFDPEKTGINDKKYTEKFHAPDARVLVVDDVTMNIEVMAGLLKNTLVGVDSVLSGEECLKAVCKEKYDIIFMDHLMPGMDGIETLSRMRKLEGNLNAKTPVIVLTANAAPGAKEEYISMGFTDYLSKPIKGSELEQIIEKYLPHDMIIQCEEESCGEEDGRGLNFLNTQAGIAFCCGDEAFYQDVLKTFAVSDIISRLNKYYTANDWDNYRVCIHSIMGTAMSIGAEELAAKTEAMKNALKSDNISYIKSHHKSYTDSCERLRSRISEFFGEGAE